MADRTITITLSGGALAYSAPGKADAKQYKVKPGDKLRWTSSDGDIAILFAGANSPFSSDKRTFAADCGDSTPFRTIEQIPKGGGAVTFKYSAALLNPATNQLVVEDPDIIVEDTGGGPGGRKAKAKKTKKAKK